MTFTGDEEDQLMFDLYEGLDTFHQTNSEGEKQASDPSELVSAEDTQTDTAVNEIDEQIDVNNAPEFQVPVDQTKEDTDVAEDAQEKWVDKSDHESYNEDEEESIAEDDDEDEDGVVFLVEEDEAAPVAESSNNEVMPQSKRKPGGWATRYQKKERVIYIGAPTSESQAMASTDPKRDCFCLVKGIPWWMDVNELNSMVEADSGTLAFSKILSDPINGESLGVALVEFVDPNTCSTFMKSKTKLTLLELSEDVFEDVVNSPLYREGIFKEGMMNRIVSHLGITVRKQSSENIKTDHFHEIEFEVCQQELFQNADAYDISKVFPWFNLRVLKLMGYSKRKEEADSDGAYQLDNHLDAYKKSQEEHKNYLSMMMPRFVMPNHMMHGTEEMGEPVKFPFPFVPPPMSSQTGIHSHRQTPKLSPAKDSKESERPMYDKPPSSKSSYSRKEKKRRPSRSPPKRRASSSRRESKQRRRSNQTYNERRHSRH